MSNEQLRDKGASDALARAIQLLGGPSAAGRALNVSHEAVRRWLSGDNRLVAERARDIETATGGQVTLKQLRPDLFEPAANI